MNSLDKLEYFYGVICLGQVELNVFVASWQLWIKGKSLIFEKPDIGKKSFFLNPCQMISDVNILMAFTAQRRVLQFRDPFYDCWVGNIAIIQIPYTFSNQIMKNINFLIWVLKWTSCLAKENSLSFIGLLIENAKWSGKLFSKMYYECKIQIFAKKNICKSTLIFTHHTFLPNTVTEPAPPFTTANLKRKGCLFWTETLDPLINTDQPYPLFLNIFSYYFMSYWASFSVYMAGIKDLVK